MSSSFKKYLNEETQISFYNLLNKEFPSKETIKTKNPNKKKKSLKKDQEEYLKLLNSYLTYTRGAMN